MAFSSFNSFSSNGFSNPINYIFQFTNLEQYLALYYPFTSSNNNKTPNYKTGIAIYDGTLVSSTISNSNTFVLGGLSLNNIMGSFATSYLESSSSFYLIPSNGLTISAWFSYSGQLDTIGTIISLPMDNPGSEITISIYGTNTISSNDTSYNSSNSFQSSDFHNVVLSISGTIHTLYLDGIQVAQNLDGENVFVNTSKITNPIIGASRALTNAFNGSIAEVRVYNDVINVSNLYLYRNLIVYYPFDTVVNKVTSNLATLSYDASFIGNLSIAYNNSLVGTGALSLDNIAYGTSSNYVLSRPTINSVPINFNSNLGLTVSSWINVNALSNRTMTIFDICTKQGTQGINIDISGTNMLYISYNSTPDITSTSTIITNSAYTNYLFNTENYRHVAFTISGNTHTLFLDGSAVSSNTITLNILTTYSSLNSLYIGTAGDLSYGYTGLIDDLKIYNRALPSSEINTIYTNNAPVFLIGHYSLDISNGNALFDSITGINTVVNNTNKIVGSGIITNSFSKTGNGSYYNTNESPSNYLSLYPINLGNSSGITVCGWFYRTNINILLNSQLMCLSTDGSTNIIIFKSNVNSYSIQLNIQDSVNPANIQSVTFAIKNEVSTVLNTTLNSWFFLSFSMTTSSVTSSDLSITICTYNSIFGFKSVVIDISSTSITVFQNKQLNTSIGHGGVKQGNTGDSFYGYIDDIRIYNGALTNSQIQSVINDNTIVYTNGMIGYYYLNDHNTKLLYDMITGTNTSDNYGTVGNVNRIIGNGNISNTLTGNEYYINTDSSSNNYLILYPVNIGSSSAFTFSGWFYNTVTQLNGSTLVYISTDISNTSINTILIKYDSSFNSYVMQITTIDVNNPTSNEFDPTTIVLKNSDIYPILTTAFTWYYLSVNISNYDDNSNVGIKYNIYAYNFKDELKEFSGYIITNDNNKTYSFSYFKNVPLYTLVGYNPLNDISTKYSFTGYVDNIRLFNYAQSQSQVQSVINYDVYLYTNSNLGYYSLDISNGNALFDNVTRTNSVVYNSDISGYVNAIIGKGYITNTIFKSGNGCYANTDSSSNNYLRLLPINIGNKDGCTVCGWFYSSSVVNYEVPLISIYANITSTDYNYITLSVLNNNSFGIDRYNTVSGIDDKQIISSVSGNVYSIKMNNTLRTIGSWFFISMSQNTRTLSDGTKTNTTIIHTYSDINGLNLYSTSLIVDKSYFQNTPIYINFGYKSFNYRYPTPPNYVNSFTGYIDDINVYDTALTSVQIQSVINSSL